MSTRLRSFAALMLAVGRLSVTAQTPSPVAGSWTGALDVGGSKLHLVFHITESAAGLVTTLDSPDQGAKELPTSSTTLAGDKLTIRAEKMHGEFVGTLSADHKLLHGTWTQGGTSLPLDLKPADAGALSAQEPKRPQTPHAPFPYRCEDVTISSAGNTLAGTLTIPAGTGPFPAVLLIAGSGPQDRDETIFSHKLFLVLADALTRKGIAVLRMDKRGIGKSTGDYGAATTADFAVDAEASFAFLRAHKDIDPTHVGVLGHSEGGLIAPMVAVHDSPAVSFVVLLAGPGVSGLEIIVSQVRLIAEASGVSADNGKTAAEQQRALLQTIVAVKDPVARDRKLHDQLLADGAPEEKIADAIRSITSPWYVSFLASDPAPALHALKVPVLALAGSKDLQVDSGENLAAIRGAVDPKLLDVTLFPGLNHLFQPAKTGAPNEYSVIETTVDPAVLDRVSTWIRARTGSK